MTSAARERGLFPPVVVGQDVYAQFALHSRVCSKTPWQKPSAASGVLQQAQVDTWLRIWHV